MLRFEDFASQRNGRMRSNGTHGFLGGGFRYTLAHWMARSVFGGAEHSFPFGIRGNMADYNKFDRRMDSLVVETRTSFSPEVSGLAAEDSQWISKAIHHHPELASQISYERAHTGFIRDIVVTAADVARLYETQAR